MVETGQDGDPSGEPRWLDVAGSPTVGSLETSVRPSPLLSAAAAAALLAAVAGPATAATGPSPAKGVASSSVTLLGVAAGGQTVSVGTLELLSDMLGAESVAKILLTPLSANGTAYGQQTITPANSPLTSPSVSTGALVPALNGVIGVSSPVFEAAASSVDGEPVAAAGAESLGSLSVLGLPVALNGGLDVGSAVSKTEGAVGEKTIVVEDVALPSVADLLAALGLDLKALPIEVLNELLEELDLVNTAVTTANTALTEATKAIQAQIDEAQKKVDAAAAALAAETAKLAGPQSELAAKEKELAAATAQLQPLKDAAATAQSNLKAAQDAAATAKSTYDSAFAAVKSAADTLGVTVEAYRTTFAGTALVTSLDSAETALNAANAAVTSAQATATQAAADLATAQSAVDVIAAAVAALKSTIATIQAAIDAAQKLLDDAVAALKSILSGVQAEIDALLGAIMAVLDGTPLVSFDSLAVVTEAAVTSNKEGGQSAKVVGGEIAGLEVLGTDVLDDVLGTSSVDLLDLAGSQLAAVNGLIAELTGTLSSVLSTVPQFPALKVPAPEVGLLTKSSSTSITDGFGVASTSVKGVSITLPSVSIPTALALPGAADLPALGGITQVAGLLTSAPIKVDLATLSSNARFAPAVTASGTPGTQTPGTETPGTAAPQLPRTGASQALAVLGVALMAAAVVARRRQSAELV
jgi:predicted  nucleic acid-binding Zn-ribbon protein